MATEIERKFLVDTRRLPPLPAPLELRQGYLSSNPSVRVRRTVDPASTPPGERSLRLTIKGPGLLSRTELEYPIPLEDEAALFALCKSTLSKLRYRIGRWEIDRFLDLPRGEFWMAEIELSSEDEPFERPDWLGEEVTHDPAYSNSRLAAPSRQ